jgi:diguanylate cyclase (GGDEF)-like protein
MSAADLSRSPPRELARRTRQQRAAARMGELAIRTRNTHELIGQLIVVLALTLDVQRAELLRLSADASLLELVAHYGAAWDGTSAAPERNDPSTQAGAALLAKAIVVVEDLTGDRRYASSARLAGAGLASSVAVPLELRARRPFGVLALHTEERRAFSADELLFAQMAASVLSIAIDRDQSSEAHRHAELHDRLTGLANRPLALERLGRALLQTAGGRQVAMIVLDLDRFDVVNDSLGHDTGDELLVTLAARLGAAVRPFDTAARIGGDEFAVVCAGVDGPAEAIRIAERIVAAVREPFALETGRHVLDASVGIALSAETDDTPESLLRNATAAAHRAKQLGRGRCELFDDRLRQRAVARLRDEAELRRALGGDELRVHYQPIVDLRTREPVALEALVRWEHPQRGLVAPGEFIPVAEETGMIAALGRWVLETAARQATVWQHRFDLPLELCVNASAPEVADPQYAQQVAALVERIGLRPGTLVLEITETMLLDDVPAPVSAVQSLVDVGLRVVLDDFGTGYSSLSYLSRFPVEAIKIDRSFVQALEQSPGDTALIDAIVRMARALHLGVVAEGVEQQQQCTTLRQLDCPRAQGYLFSRPLAATALEQWLQARGA